MTINFRLYLPLLLALLCACEPSLEDRPRATMALTPCAREGTPPVVGGAECGVLTVSENPEAPDGSSIDIHLMRWPAISAVPEADPVFIIAGGPGQSAIATADFLAPVFYNLRKNRDIVFVDQRGTGQSHPLHCEQDDEGLPLMEYAEVANARNLERLRQCAETWRDHAAYYTTDHAVTDLEAVRRSLGYGQINLWGASYGTRVILRYLQRYPQSLRAVVLDGLAPVQIALPEFLARDAGQSLQKVSEDCLAREDCARAYGDVAEKARRLAARLAQQPVALEVPHPLTGESTKIRLDHDKLASLVRLSLYDRLLARLLPHTLALAEAGDYQVLATLTTQLFDSESLPQIAEGMHLTVLCNEDAPLTSSASSQTFLGVNLQSPVTDVCEFWPRAQVPENFYRRVVSDVPALLLSGGRDPVTPPRWGEQVAAHLTRATHLIAPGAHHGVTPQGCAADLVTDFIRDLELADDAQQCLRKIEPLVPYVNTALGESSGD